MHTHTHTHIRTNTALCVIAARTGAIDDRAKLTPRRAHRSRAASRAAANSRER
jgi:hypothetical protein